MRIRSIAMTTALVGSLAFAPFSTQASQAEGTGSDNFTLVQNVPHSSGGRGSDIEFATYTFADAAAAAAAGYRHPAADADPATDGIQKDIALAGTTGVKFYLYDVTTPGAVYETAAYECPANQGDTQVFHRDGKTYTTYTVEDSSAGGISIGTACYKDAFGGLPGQKTSGTFIIDISNPFAPKAVAHIPVAEGSHNGTVHPSGNYFYNSNSSLWTDTALDGGAGIEYYDISDFKNIKRLGRLFIPPVPASLGTESHDITFDASGDRGYSAALSQGLILDTSNPAAPKILTQFVDPTIQVWHQSDPIDIGARRFLFIEDEVAGATGTGQCPNGGVHIYEVTGPMELAPVKVGYFNIDEVRTMGVSYSCTAHVFRLYPEANMATISYYNGGVRVLDLGNMVGIGLGGSGGPVTLNAAGYGQDPITQVGFRRFPDSNSWAAKTPRIPVDADGVVGDFTVFSNGGRGLDVLAFDADDTASAAYAAQFGRWMTPAEVEMKSVKLTPSELQAALPEYSCLLR